MSDSASPPLVSVLISTCNRAPLLARAIDSVLAQDYAPLELVVVDDGSTDDTPQVLAGYRRDPRVVVLRNARNEGLQKSLNRALAAARGDWLARLDDDDRWSDTRKLSLQLALARNEPGLVVVGTAYVDEQGKPITNPLTDAEIRTQMLFRCPFCHSSVLIRAGAVRAVGGYDEGLPYAEDWDLWMRLGQDGRLANLPEVTVIRERGANTMSEQYFLRQLDLARQLVTRHGSHYPRRLRARIYHALSRVFFRWFPTGGRMHRLMGAVFARRFRLERS